MTTLSLGTVTVTPKSKNTLLPLLTILFLVSYGLMAFLVVEQGRTIDSQRNLIRQLFSDSSELSALQGKLFQQHRAETQAQAKAKGHAQAKTPANNQAQAQAQVETPTAQVSPRTNEKARKAGKLHKPLPRKPPVDGTELQDERWSVNSI